MSGNNGTLSPGVQIVNTPLGKACTFDGAGNISHSAVTLSTDAATVVLTFRWDADGNYRSLLGNADNTTNYIAVVGGTNQIVGETSTGGDNFSATWAEDTKYHRLVVVFDNKTVQMHLDNTALSMLDSSVTGSQIVFSKIGSMLSSFYWIGDIKDVQCFNRVLSSDEIQADYEKFASLCTFFYDANDSRVSLANETGGRLSNAPFRISTGTWKISEDTTGRYIDCVSSGNLICDRVGSNNDNTKQFVYSGTASLTKAADKLTLTATTGAKIRLIHFTVGS